MPTQTSCTWNDWRGCQRHRFRKPKYPERRDLAVLHHGLGNCGDPGADAGGLRESGCLRFRKELASVRGINSCIIRIAYTFRTVYESDATARAVIHCHDMKLWAALLGKAPTTPKRAEYGTPEMAYAVRRLFEATDVEKREIFVMAAHDGGLVTFGKDLQDAFGILRQPIAELTSL
ncbi:MAG: hypothetical protein WA183_16515 [Chthoniobacterales bacterium]